MNQNPKYSDEHFLLESFKNNDLPAFRALYDIYYHQIYNYANRIVNDPEQAEDIISESFVIIWQKRMEFNSLKSVASYLYVVTRNSCFAHLKKLKKNNITRVGLAYQHGQQDLLNAADSIQADLIQLSMIAAQQLPKEMKKVFELIYIEGFSATEAAEKLQLSVNTVNVQRANAVKRLRATLIKKGFLITF